MVRKFFNIKSKTKDSHQAHSVPCGGGGDFECRSRSSLSEREPCTLKKSKTEKFSRNSDQVRRGRMNLDHPRIIDVHNYSIFVATWNAAGRSPPSNLSIDDWLHASPPADIYVLGFQEIVPLNAGNILVAEDNGPASEMNRLKFYVTHAKKKMIKFPLLKVPRLKFLKIPLTTSWKKSKNKHLSKHKFKMKKLQLHQRKSTAYLILMDKLAILLQTKA